MVRRGRDAPSHFISRRRGTTNCMALIPVDKNRYLIKSAGPEKISGKWKELIDEIVATCKAHLREKLISVYVGGSVALGEAKEYKSDVDTYAIVSMNDLEAKDAETNWVKSEIERLNKKFPFQRGVEILLKPLDSLHLRKKFQMKVIAAHVYGKDFDSEIGPFKLDKETLKSIRYLPENEIKSAKRKLELFNTSEKIKETAIWISKRLVRGGGTLVLWEQDFYTMDVNVLANLFIERYSNKANEMKTALNWITNAPENKQEVLDFLDSFGSWLIEEDNRIFGI